MPFSFRLYSVFVFLLLNSLFVKAQDHAIGHWRSYLPYSNVVAAATDGNKIFVAGTISFFTYDILKNEISTYSKTNGMSDIELSTIAHDPINGVSILAYNNSNIDLFKNETFYNIPDLKLRSVTGDKSIYSIFLENGVAYLSTGIGILVLNLDKKEVKETYVFSKGNKNYAVKDMTGDNTYFYAGTDNGLYKTRKTNANIQASSSWTVLDSTRKLTHTCNTLNKIFVSTNDSVFVLDSDSLSYVYSLENYIVHHIDPIENGINMTFFNATERYSITYSFDNAFNKIDSIKSGYQMQSLQTSDHTIWVADLDLGLRNKEKSIIPNGPFNIGSYDILANNGTVYIAHGSYDDRWNIAVNASGISILENNDWKIYNRYTYPNFSQLSDAVRLALDPTDQTLYIASQTEGLFYLKKDGSSGQYKEGVFDVHLIDPFTYRLSGVAFDQNNNLWVTQTDAAHELVARSVTDNNWYKFSLPSTRPRPYWENGAAGLIIDDYNQKWFFSPAGGGVIIFDDNNTIDNASDDRAIKLLSGKGAGNLPDNLVQCIVNDKKGAIWIGTNNGIGIINCPDRVLDGTCEAEIRVVQYDQFPGELFAGENVKTIAVDGANRKWIGTGNGVWLISEDANKLIYRFTTQNSPLPSNVIQTIKVDPVTGDVYFGTDKGLVSFRSTATDGGSTNKDVLIFPNPIKKDYMGTIAIKGLVDNADVRITDISGQLIYRSKALGGQAIWDGKDYTGHRPQTGVFLVFATNNLGTEKFVGKMVFIN